MAKTADKTPKHKKPKKDKVKGKGKAEVQAIEVDRTLVLYQIVRTDLASMPSGCGKAVAQGGHAATAAVIVGLGRGGEVRELVQEWAGDRGFGTAISLGANEETLRARVAEAERLGVHAGLIVDPTYPLVDGEVVHLIELTTSGYVFGRRYLVSPLMEGLDKLP